MVLNFKKIKYTQSWVDSPDIAPLLESLKVAPLAGDTPYTFPAIVHKSSIKSNPYGVMNNTFPIALHLEETFPIPQYPSIFPNGDSSYALAVAVERLVGVAMSKAYPLVVPLIPLTKGDRGAAYYNETRKKAFGVPLTEMRPKTKEGLQKIWEETKKELEVFTAMLSGKKGKKGPFFEGEKPGYADLMLVAWLAIVERLDKETFEVFLTTGDGSLHQLWEALLPYVNGQGEEVEWTKPSI